MSGSFSDSFPLPIPDKGFPAVTKIQKGTSTNSTITISPVDPKRTLLRVEGGGGYHSGSAGTAQFYDYIIWNTPPDSISLGAYSRAATWEAIEFSSMKSIQYGSISLGSGGGNTYIGTITISPVDLSKSSLFFGVNAGFTGTGSAACGILEPIYVSSTAITVGVGYYGLSPNNVPSGAALYWTLVEWI